MQDKRKHATRTLLAVMIALNMLMIFFFSAQTGAESRALSSFLTTHLLNITSNRPTQNADSATAGKPMGGTSSNQGGTANKNESTSNENESSSDKNGSSSKKPSSGNTKTPSRNKAQRARVGKIVRKIAHMVEFGLLGLLILLFAATWEDRELPLKYFIALAFVLFYAATDELHQLAVSDRAGLFVDVLIDLTGAVITCTAALPILLHKQKKKLAKQRIPTTE